MEIKEMITELERMVKVLGGNAAALRTHFSPVSDAADAESAEEIKRALINFEVYLRNVKEKVVGSYLLWEKIMDELKGHGDRPLNS